MRTIQIFFTIFIGMQLVIGQNIQIAPDRFGSDNYQERSVADFNSESIVNIYSNIAIAELFVWNIPFQSSRRTFPAKLALPADNQRYTISLYSQSEYQEIAEELQTFDFNKRDIEEFEILQDDLLKIQLATKNILPVPGIESSLFLTYCSDKDLNCEEGMHWLDQFYSHYYNTSQEKNVAVSNNSQLKKEREAIIRKHRIGIFSMVSFFSMAMLFIDGNIQ